MPTTSISTPMPNPHTRSTYQHLLSPSRRQAKAHNKCTLIDFPPIGIIRSCTSPLLLRISDTISQCSAFVPSISLLHLLRLMNLNQTNTLLTTDFPSCVLSFDNGLYVDCESQIKRLRQATKVLSKIVTFGSALTSCQRKHFGNPVASTLPSDNLIFIVIQNLEILSQCIKSKQQAIEVILWNMLDKHPERSELMLQNLVKKFSDNPCAFNGKLPHVTLTSFQTLNAGRWLDDEMVNYFVKKWCFKSGTTLGFNTFFACKVLFQETECINAREGFLTNVDEDTVRRWCAKAATAMIGTSGTGWDSVFIPINEDSTHWYSAHIDFRSKRIDIFDSLRDRCIQNRQKPLLERKNSKLMLVLMWLADVLGRMRGEDIMLKNNPNSDWICDPHFKVHFQANSHDCGVHMLWHLKHLLEFRQVRLGPECSQAHLRFNDNMAGKRLRLVQEMLLDAGLL
ncbi:hypothetical protein D9757_013038 [Collybiopsis confluens]|uniref:Ubiquitin-like protease family profile domain-containing protein n=1 Tax=Collybiopsis confluens TaxID=2823264 RepID=A0A8H5GH33_9AGAR|nr:hypothetical protein D9757_013038 [Collybiopsis confluens]